LTKEESVMNRALVILGIVAVFAVASPPARALENCYTVRGTADARNRQVSLDRAERRLHHHIAHELRGSTGHSVGPTHTHCIRNACEASAIVCRH
jgi:hypothetical protein